MNDYGYFGKGISGYVHYNQAFKRNFGSGGGGDRQGSGCFTLLIIITVPILIPFIISAL